MSGGGGQASPPRWVEAYRIRLPSGKKYGHVVRPLPLERRRVVFSGAFGSISKIWSQAYGGRVEWKMSFFPSADQYASAFSPPNVSWRTFARCLSPSYVRGESVPSNGLGGGPCAANAARPARAAMAVATARGRLSLLINRAQYKRE